MIRSLVPSRIEELVRDLDSDVEDVRKAAVVWLAQMRDPTTLPHLAKRIDDVSPAVRYFARRAVDELKVRPALEKLPLGPEDIVMNLTAPEREKRIAAAMACYALHDPQLLPHLVRALDGETDLHVIATLVKAIGAQRDPAVIPRLVHLLHHTDARVRSNTVDATMLLDDADVLDAVSLLAADVSNRVRSSVALFLAHRDPQRVHAMVREMIDTDLIWMKDSAVYVMHAVGAPWCMPLLEEMATRESPTEPVGRKVALALGQLRARMAGKQEDPLQLSVGGVDAKEIAAIRARVRAEAEAAKAAKAAASTGAEAGAGAEGGAAQDAVVSSSAAAVPATGHGAVGTEQVAASAPVTEAQPAASAPAVAGAPSGAAAAIYADLTEEARQAFARLGTQAFMSSRIGELPEADLAAQAEKVAALGASLDRGKKLGATLELRDIELITLGRMVLGAARDGLLENESLVREALRVEEVVEGKPEVRSGAATIEGSAVPTRSTLKEQVLSADARGRPTQRQHVVAGTRQSQAISPGGTRQSAAINAPGTRQSKAIPAPEPGARAWLARNKLLVAPAALAVLVVGGLVWGVSERAQSVVAKVTSRITSGPTKFEASPTIEELMASKSPSSFKNRFVRWNGVVREKAGSGNRLLIAMGRFDVSAEFESAVASDLTEDCAVQVDGTVESVVNKVAHIKGKSVLFTAPTPFERKQRKRQREIRKK